MKLFFKNLLWFSFLAMSIYLFLIILWGEVLPTGVTKNLKFEVAGNGHLLTRLKEVEATKDADILVLGSSKAYRGYDPRIFKEYGYTLFNLGSSAQTFLQTEMLVEKYIDSLNPKIVIFDVYPYLFHLDGIESSLDIISNSRLDRRMAQLVLEQNNIKLYNTFLFSAYKDFFNMKSSTREPLKKGDDTYISGGFVENFTSKVYENDPRKGKIVILDEQLKAFNSIIKTLKEKKVKFILVQSPTSYTQKNSFENNEAIDVLIKEKGDYFNFNNILNMDDSLFKDHAHLNQKGVRFFNKILIEKLQAQGLLAFDSNTIRQN